MRAEFYPKAGRRRRSLATLGVANLDPSRVLVPRANRRQEAAMAVRTSIAKWEGALKDGHGTMSLGSGAFEGQYSFSSRFEEGTGTNPEELIGAAHAGCFSMAFANILAEA